MYLVNYNHHHHHHMALQPNSGSGLPLWTEYNNLNVSGWAMTGNVHDTCNYNKLCNIRKVYGITYTYLAAFITGT
jgi:hypothetical protein